MKKLTAVLICLMLLFCCAVPVFAEIADPDESFDAILADESELSGLADAYGVIVNFEGVLTDSAELLTPDEKAELTEQLELIGNKYNCDVCVVTVNSLNGKDPQEYADDYFDYNGYGRNSTADGILFLLSMEDRDWAISTCGNCIDAFTDNGQAYMIGKMKIDLSANRFAAAIKTYADTCDELLKMWSEGKPYDRQQSTLYKLMHVMIPVGILISIGVGFLLSSIPMGKLKNEISNVKWQTAASDYTRQGSMQLHQSQDQFLYTNTTRVKIESSSTRSGSSTHTSSSGRTHGGSSGKF